MKSKELIKKDLTEFNTGSQIYVFEVFKSAFLKPADLNKTKRLQRFAIALIHIMINFKLSLLLKTESVKQPAMRHAALANSAPSRAPTPQILNR